MKEEFIEKVKRMEIYDTRKYRYVYRYVYKEGFKWERIKRIELRYLNTKKSLTEWEIVLYRKYK